MNVYLPEEVERLVDAGLETCESFDRYIALGAANQADEERFGQSQFGLEVARIFMDDWCVSLQEGTKKIATRGWGDYMKRGEFLIRQEVSRAIGDTIDVRSAFYEFVGANTVGTGSIVLTEEGKVSAITNSFSPARPYVVIQQYGNDWSRRNFMAAVEAVQGRSGKESPLDDLSLMSALPAIQALAERAE